MPAPPRSASPRALPAPAGCRGRGAVPPRRGRHRPGPVPARRGEPPPRPAAQAVRRHGRRPAGDRAGFRRGGRRHRRRCRLRAGGRYRRCRRHRRRRPPPWRTRRAAPPWPKPAGRPCAAPSPGKARRRGWWTSMRRSPPSCRPAGMKALSPASLPAPSVSVLFRAPPPRQPCAQIPFTLPMTAHRQASAANPFAAEIRAGRTADRPQRRICGQGTRRSPSVRVYQPARGRRAGAPAAAGPRRPLPPGSHAPQMPPRPGAGCASPRRRSAPTAGPGRIMPLPHAR